jgi:mannose-6-phosphate isomerase
MERMPEGYHGTPRRQPGGPPVRPEAGGPAGAAARDAFRRYVSWLRDDSFPAWRRAGFDAGSGLFFEKLTLAGRPDRAAELRLRTHMRQVYCFAHGATLGLTPAGDGIALAARALDNIATVAFSPDGRPGWVHRLSQDGTVVDDRRDLYDHAFVLLALAHVFAVTGEPRYEEAIAATLSAIDNTLAAPNGGWAESDRHELPRRQNPHMHLFEASLALHEITGEAAHLARATVIFHLFLERFYDRRYKVLREYFGIDWRLGPEYRSGRIEPGHNVEWVWLLRRFARSAPGEAAAAGIDAICADLLASAERLGLHDGFLVDETDLAGRATVDGRRLWPQTEHIKAHLVQYEATGGEHHLVRAGEIVDRLFATYLAGPKAGLWVDRFALDGRVAVDHVPASILYHLVVPAAEMIRLGLVDSDAGAAAGDRARRHA